MSIKIENTDQKNELKLEFTIEAKKFEEGILNIFKKNVKYFNIPGFRKGKAPQNIVERYYGKEIFYEDAFNEVVPEIYNKELKENNIEAVSTPNVDIIQMEKGKDLIFTATIQIKPEFTLGKYSGIELEKIEYTVKDEDIEHELKHMAERNSRLEVVDNRPVKDGDITTIDFEGSVDGEAFEGGKSENYELTIGSKTFIPGFEEQIIGMNIDEEKDIKVKFPDEYFSEELAGKEAIFKVVVHEIKQKEMPEIDDEFAKDVSEFDTLDELKKDIQKRLEEDNKKREKFETEEAAIKAVCDATEIDIPSGMINSEVDDMVHEIEHRLYYQGLTLDQYLSMMGKTNNEFRKEYEEQAKKSVKSKLVLEKIAKEESIEIKEDEVNNKIKDLAEEYRKNEDELKNNQMLIDHVKDELKNEKAIEFIVNNAKIKKNSK